MVNGKQSESKGLFSQLHQRWNKIKARLDVPDFGADQKYYACFARIWGWTGYKQNRDRGLRDLESLMNRQCDVPWDQKEPFHPDLQFEMGVAYLKGWLTSGNSNEPLLWFSRSAEQGSARGLMAMGYLYEKGLSDCSRDPIKMITYYRRAAELGNASAMYRLAVIALKLKLKNRENVRQLLVEAAPDYRPAKVLLVREFPEVTSSRKYRKLFEGERKNIAAESIPDVEVPSENEIMRIIRKNNEQLAEQKQEVEQNVVPDPVPVRDANTSLDESQPDAAAITPVEEQFVAEGTIEQKAIQFAVSAQIKEEFGDMVAEAVDQILREFAKFQDESRKYQQQAREDREQLKQTSNENLQVTRSVKKTAQDNQELIINLGVSIGNLQSSLDTMWSELQAAEEEIKQQLCDLKTETEQYLRGISEDKLAQAEAFMALIFGGDWRKNSRLCNESCDALVAAHVLMAEADKIGIKNYAGIVITAVWALEHECRRRFYVNFDRYLESIGVKAAERPARMRLADGGGRFTLGSVCYVTYSNDFNQFSKAKNLLSEVAKREQRKKGYDDAKMIWKYYLPGIKGPDGKGQSFSDVVRKLNDDYRKPAAHANAVSKEHAAACYRMLGITEVKQAAKAQKVADAQKDIIHIQGALKALLWLTAPLEES